MRRMRRLKISVLANGKSFEIWTQSSVPRVVTSIQWSTFSGETARASVKYRYLKRMKILMKREEGFTRLKQSSTKRGTECQSFVFTLCRNSIYREISSCRRRFQISLEWLTDERQPQLVLLWIRMVRIIVTSSPEFFGIWCRFVGSENDGVAYCVCFTGSLEVLHIFHCRRGFAHMPSQASFRWAGGHRRSQNTY